VIAVVSLLTPPPSRGAGLVDYVRIPISAKLKTGFDF
jgi:hypothetical protein